MRALIINNTDSVSGYLLERLGDIKYFFEKNINIENTISNIFLKKPDIIFIDSIKMFNQEDYFLIIESIRSGHIDIPIILIVSGGESVSYIQKALDLGVDSCIKGDFLRDELILRANKLINRKNNLLFAGTSINTFNIKLDIKNHTVFLDNKEVFLTKTEYNILFHLFMHKNTLIKNEELNSCLRSNSLIRSDYLLNTHIHNLRKKLNGAKWIKTITNYGFVVIDN